VQDVKALWDSWVPMTPIIDERRGGRSSTVSACAGIDWKGQF
jgi:hypothetical protein